MATEDSAPDWDDGTAVETPGTDDVDEQKLTIDPGEKVVVQIRHIEPNAGDYDSNLLHLTTDDGQPVFRFSNSTIDHTIEKHNLGPGDWIGIKKHEESFPVERDGEQHEAHEYTCKVFDR